MHLKNRLKKIEVQINVTSKVCQCVDRLRCEIYQRNLTENSTNTEPQLKGEIVSEHCPICRKPVDKQIIIVNICDKTTKI